MIEAVLGITIVLAVVALEIRDLLASVLVIGLFSLVSCLLYFMLHAPDVALTEAAVGTGIGTVVFIWIISKTERRDKTREASNETRS